MMNVDKDNVEPVTNLQLAVAYRYPFAPRRLSNLDVGAGANAASRVDLDFVAAAPLSELVWSPHNGLSLKCADLRFFEKKTSLLWDVGPSNMVLSPPQGTTSKVPGREEPRDEGNLITSQVAFHVTSIIDEGPSLVRSPRSIGYNTSRTTDNIEKMNIVGRASKGDTNLKEVKTSKGKDLCSPNNNQMYSMDETKEINSGPKNQKTDFTLLKTNERRSNIIQDEPLDELNEVKVGLDVPVPNLISPVGRREDLSVAIEEEHKNKMKIDGPTNGMPLEKLDLSTENELQLLIVKDKSAASEAPSSNSRTGLNGRKHKEKAFSDEAVNERTSKDEPGSHESVESCNSAGPAVLFSTGKKRWGFEQLTAESKRVKKQIREGPSTCFIRQDSSFVNWISNMVNGLNKTNQDEVPSLALTLSRPDHEAESGNQKIITYSRNKDPGSMNMDFQTNFQSLYSSNPNEQERKMSIGNSPIGVSKVVLDDKLSGAYITPLSCYGDFDEFCKQFVLPKEKFNESKSGNEAGPSVKPNTLAANIITSSCSDQNKTSCKLACTSVRDGRYSSSSRGKHNIESDKNNDSDLPHGLEGIDKVGGRCDVLESFWFTRFSSKTPRTMLNWDKCDQNTSEALMCSTDCTRLIAHTNDRINQKSSDAKEYSTEVPVNVVGKELHNYAPNSEASFGFGGIHGHSDQKSTCKLNPIVPSPKSNNSEAMASVFAKRLDALKHIIPLDVTDNTRHTRTTCFYCGKSGHNLRHCSEIEEIERENLIRNLSSYDGAEESPCLCIRCFQLDHWAISCLKETKQTHCEVDGENTDCEDNVLKEKKIGPSSQLVDEKFSDVQKGIFDAIRRLCLSRMDILKWMNSQTSSLHLDGFFLRLRLGKWEEALGGTGYYVACITGEQREKPPQGSKKPLSVNIGGIRCMVESQYISNQDFLQDELMVWWCATVRSGGKIPSEDHLKSKFEERQRLGF